MQKRGADLLGSGSDPGICERQGMAGLDARGALQQGLRDLNPLQGQGLELLIGQAASALLFILPDAIKHFHPTHKTGVAVLWLLERLFDTVGSGFIVAQGQQC